MATTLAHLNGSAPPASSWHNQPWLQQSVRELFSAINWDDQPEEVHDLSQELALNAVQGGNMSLSMTLTVRQFFSAVPWDGAEIAAMVVPAPVEDPALANAADDLTLDGFSGLFG